MTKEIGLKGGMLDNRVTFTLGAFQIDRQNNEFRGTPSGFSAGDVENLMNPNTITADDPRYVTSWHDVNQYRSILSTEFSRGFDLTLLTRPALGLQARFTVGRADVITRPDFSSSRAYYEAAVKRGDEAPSLIADAKEVLESSDFATKPSGARAARRSASWILDYDFARDAWTPLRGTRVGVNAYAMRGQRVWGQQVRLRPGVRSLIDLENTGDTRKTGFTKLAKGTVA